MTAKEKLEEMTNIELAELMVENIEQFQERDSVEIAETWDRCDMIQECEWACVVDDDDE
ncbi:MAG: hypothetical protein AABY15_06670 [Nanoarchaeota archaeon]